MTYTTRIEVGQRWRGRGLRDNGRTVTVVEVDPRVNEPGNNGFVTVKWVRRSRMRATGLRRRYTLVEDASTERTNRG